MKINGKRNGSRFLIDQKSLIVSEKLKELVCESRRILDIGTGPNGSFWYDYVSDDAEVVGIDPYFEPSRKTKNYTYCKMDGMDLENLGSGVFGRMLGRSSRGAMMTGNFDLIVANHVFEHVENPEKLAIGVSKMMRKDGRVFISIPDPNNFTDIFYHLIHPEGGGHISLITKERMLSMMKKNGFELEHYGDIPDDWLWLEKLFDWRSRNVQHFSDENIRYLADTFRKELTPAKGYFYGGEYVFVKKL